MYIYLLGNENTKTQAPESSELTPQSINSAPTKSWAQKLKKYKLQYDMRIFGKKYNLNIQKGGLRERVRKSCF